MRAVSGLLLRHAENAKRQALILISVEDFDHVADSESIVDHLYSCANLRAHGYDMKPTRSIPLQKMTFNYAV